jgi:hypothetical protein
MKLLTLLVSGFFDYVFTAKRRIRCIREGHSLRPLRKIL